MKDYILEQLSALTAIPSPSGYTRQVAEYVLEQLRGMGYQPELSNKGNVSVTLGGSGNPLVLSAHLDTLGAMVRKIKDSGRRRTPVGYLRRRKLHDTYPGRTCLYRRCVKH